MAKKKNCCTAPMIIGHLLGLLGLYLLTAGFTGDYALISVLKSSIFWGLFFILVAMHPKRNMKR